MNIELLREIITRNATLDPNDDLKKEKCWNCSCLCFVYTIKIYNLCDIGRII